MRNKKAFTLIELLVVIFILAILVSLVVGVSAYIRNEAARKETEATQTILADAIRTYRDMTGVIPGSEKPGYIVATSGLETGENDEGSGETLILYLTGDAGLITDSTLRAKIQDKVVAKLRNLSQEAYNSDTGGEVRDGWDTPLRYDSNSGLGGTFVIISCGPDRETGTTADTEEPEEEDNIRSDGK